MTANQQLAVQQQLAAARAAPTEPDGLAAPASPQALAGLALPGTAPALPNVPGIKLQQPAPAPLPAFVQQAVVKTPRPDGPPVILAFRPQSALLTSTAQTALRAIAVARGSANIRVAGFGEQDSAAEAAPDAAALALALHRARRIADALTASGVPPDAITLTAAAAGSGGFVQLVY